MKNNLRVLSVLFALILCVCALGACGAAEDPDVSTAANGEGLTLPKQTHNQGSADDDSTEVTEHWVAPADQVGLVVSADKQLITWQPYAVEGDTIDFKGLDLDSLGMAGEMSLAYMEAEVTYYSLVNGKLEEVTVDEVVAGSVIGITTLEEGVQEVYILSVPTGEEVEEMEDPLEEIVEETLPNENATSTTEADMPEEMYPEEDTSEPA